MNLERSHARRLGFAVAAAVLVVTAPAAHAFTMNTLSSPDGGARYADPGDQLQDMAKGKTTTDQSAGGLHFSVGGSQDGGGFSDPVGRPLDQRFMNR
jgi:hypothetical protein